MVHSGCDLTVAHNLRADLLSCKRSFRIKYYSILLYKMIEHKYIYCMGSTYLNISISNSHLLAAYVPTLSCQKFDLKLLKTYHQIHLQYPITSLDYFNCLSGNFQLFQEKNTFKNIRCIWNTGQLNPKCCKQHRQYHS